jgi:hypothetical protein
MFVYAVSVAADYDVTMHCLHQLSDWTWCHNKQPTSAVSIISPQSFTNQTNGTIFLNWSNITINHIALQIKTVKKLYTFNKCFYGVSCNIIFTDCYWHVHNSILYEYKFIIMTTIVYYNKTIIAFWFQSIHVFIDLIRVYWSRTSSSVNILSPGL